MKIKKIIMLFLMCAITAVVLAFYTSDGATFARRYMAINGCPVEKAPGYNHLAVKIPYGAKIKEASPFDVVDILESNKDAFVLFGYPECPWCRNFAPVVAEVVKETKIDNFYYCDIASYSDQYNIGPDGNIVKTREGKEGYLDLITNSEMQNWLWDYTLNVGDEEYDVGEKRIYVPCVFFISNGKVIDRTFYGVKLPDGQSKYDEWTKEQKNTSKMNLINFIDGHAATND